MLPPLWKLLQYIWATFLEMLKEKKVYLQHCLSKAYSPGGKAMDTLKIGAKTINITILVISNLTLDTLQLNTHTHMQRERERDQGIFPYEVVCILTV